MATLRKVSSGEGLNLLPERIRLPRGRSALSADEVARSQRGRILQAIVEQVAAQGYHATSVQDVIARASVSRKAFYDYFVDKEDAFAEAHAEASQQLLDLIRAAARSAPATDWRARHRLAVRAYLDGLIAAPAYATSFIVELRSCGTRLLDQRDQFLELHARGIRTLAEQAHREHPERPLPSRLAVIGAAGAADELVTREVRAGRTGELARLRKPIVEIHLAVIRGPSR